MLGQQKVMHGEKVLVVGELHLVKEEELVPKNNNDGCKNSNIL